MQCLGVPYKAGLLLMSSALKATGSTSKWIKIAKRIRERDGYTCMICGMDGNSIDHIIPRSAGGTDDDWNLQCLCVSCNSRKGGRFFNTTPTPLTLSCSENPQNRSMSHE